MIDRSFATQLAEDLSPEDFRRIVTVFGADLHRLIDVMTEAAAKADVSAFRRAAHGLAGAAGAVGATPLERACRAAMAVVEPSGLAEALAPLRNLGDASQAELATLVGSLNRSP